MNSRQKAKEAELIDALSKFETTKPIQYLVLVLRLDTPKASVVVPGFLRRVFRKSGGGS